MFLTINILIKMHFPPWRVPTYTSAVDPQLLSVPFTYEVANTIVFI